jgi:CheY-like chemotaxis protein
MTLEPHILLVDDHDSTRLLVALMLQHQLPGARVTPCTDGHHAFTTYQQLGADVIVSDCQMPTMTGMELAMALRQQGATVPIILASSDARLRLACMQAGADCFVEKDQPEHLLAAVRHVLHQNAREVGG